MKYLILIFGVYVWYRFFYLPRRSINRGKGRDDLDLKDPPDPKKEYEEEYIDYDEIE